MDAIASALLPARALGRRNSAEESTRAKSKWNVVKKNVNNGLLSTLYQFKSAGKRAQDRFHHVMEIPSTERTPAMYKSIVAHAKTLRFFEELSELEITAVLTHCTLRTYADKTMVFDQGDAGHFFYIIASGAVELFVHKGGSEPPAFSH